MAKISTYDSVPPPASLSDMLIGTDVSNSDKTVNFSLSQILSLYPQITQKILVYNNGLQVFTPGVEAAVEFNTTQFQTNNFTVLPGNASIQFSNGGYYLVQFSASGNCSVPSPDYCFAWLLVNGVPVSVATTVTVTPNQITRVNFSWIHNFNPADILSVVCYMDTNTLIFDTAAAVGSRPLVPGAQLLISQV